MLIKLLEPLHRWLTAYMGATGLLLYGGGKGGSSAPAPDPRLVEAQIKSMGIQDDVIKQIMANSTDMAPLQKQQLQFGLDSSRTAYDQSQKDREWTLGRRGELTGLQDKQIKDAADFDVKQRGDEFASEAMADVNAGFANAQAQGQRSMAARGVNPNSGAALALESSGRLQQALGLAGAANGARKAARTEGYGLTDRASNTLAGYPAMGMTATGAGAGYGTSGVTVANAGLAGMNSGYGAAAGVAGSMGSNATGMYGAQASYKNNADQIAGNNDPFKTILGAAAGMGSAYALNGFKFGKG